MLKKLGRLNHDDIRQINELIEEIFNLLDTDKEAGEKKLISISKTPNYFIREELGKLLVKYHDKRKMVPLCKRMLKHKFYGVRATGLFYFFNNYRKEPNKIVDVLAETFETVPWESENIANVLWKEFPDVMKERMLEWIKSDNEKQRAISFHGMENIAASDPTYIMSFLAHAIDDESMEVQKKITHILTQVARSKPSDCYPYIREWLLNAGEIRMKTLWVSMKKLANIVIQKSKRDKTPEFIMLTNQTINDWKRDTNANVANMGKKLGTIINNK